MRVVPFLTARRCDVQRDGDVRLAGRRPGAEPARSTGGLAFSPPATIVDAQRTEGEPLNYIDRTATTGIPARTASAPASRGSTARPTAATSSTSSASPASGRTRRPAAVTRTSWSTTRATAYFVDLEGLAELSCAVSEDNGNNWSTNQACVADTVVDRQWFAVDNGTDAGADRQHGLPRVPADAARLVHLLDAGGGRARRSGRRRRLPELVGRPREPGQSGRALRTDALRPGRAQPLLPVHPGRPRRDHRGRTSNPGQRTGIVYTNVQAPVSPGGGPVGDLFPICRHGLRRQSLCGLDRRDRPQRLLRGLARTHGHDLGPGAPDQRERRELERVHVGAGRRSRHARRRLARQQLAPRQRSHAVLVQQPPGGQRSSSGSGTRR